VALVGWLTGSVVE